MAYDDVFCVSDKLDVASADELARAAAALNVRRWPQGYSAFVTTLGAGDYTNYVRVLLPSQIVTDCAEQREGWTAYAAVSVQQSRAILPLPRLLEAIPLATTVDGDAVVFHPDDPAALYFLDTNADAIQHIGRTVEEALDWMVSAATQQESVRLLDATDQFVVHDLRYFEPYADRARVQFGLHATVAPEAVRAHLVALARYDRTGARCLIHRSPDDEGAEREWVQLLVRRFGGIVSCYVFPQAEGGTQVTISYDQEQRTRPLETLLAYFEPLATVPLDREPDPSAPVWDRSRRDWIEPTL